MKIRLVVALAGLAISFAVPAIAQQKDTADPQLREALAAYNKKKTRHGITTMRSPWPRSTPRTRFW